MTTQLESPVQPKKTTSQRGAAQGNIASWRLVHGCAHDVNHSDHQLFRCSSGNFPSNVDGSLHGNRPTDAAMTLALHKGGVIFQNRKRFLQTVNFGFTTRFSLLVSF